jgi:hypothetical protein
MTVGKVFASANFSFVIPIKRENKKKNETNRHEIARTRGEEKEWENTRMTAAFHSVSLPVSSVQK